MSAVRIRCMLSRDSTMKLEGKCCPTGYFSSVHQSPKCLPVEERDFCQLCHSTLLASLLHNTQIPQLEAIHAVMICDMSYPSPIDSPQGYIADQGFQSQQDTVPKYGRLAEINTRFQFPCERLNHDIRKKPSFHFIAPIDR